MQKERRTIMGLVFFALLLTTLVTILAITDTLFSDPIPSILMLACFAVAGVAVLARGADRNGSMTLSGGHAMRSWTSRLHNAAHHMPIDAKKTHPTRVRLRVERWENERRSIVEEPLKKALQRAHSRACPMCGSRAANACACRYRSRFH